MDAITITYTSQQVERLKHGNEVYKDALAKAEFQAQDQGRRLTGEYEAVRPGGEGDLTITFTLEPQA